jgi:hypothetical protein
MQKLFVTIVFSLIAKFVIAQAGMTNNGKLYVFSEANLTSFIDIENKSGAEWLNNGTVHSKANFRNDQTLMVAGTGILYIDGASAQQVDGAATLVTYNLVTDNPSGITLNNSVSIAATHTFTTGMIVTSGSANYLIYQEGSSYAGAADSRHVNGWVKKYGATDFVFPLGNAGYLRSVAITNLSATAEFNAHYYPGTANIYNLWSPLVQVHANEYWQINKITGGTAKVTLNWEHSKVTMDNVLVPDIQVGQYFGANWHSAGGVASGTVTTTGTIQSNTLNSFGEITFGYKSFPVPLKLISFEGEKRETVNLLHWISENEYNVDRFEIQKSIDAVNYSAIGTVRGRNSSEREYYNYSDRSATGIVYYRLRMIDFDGSYTYSRIIAIANAADGSGILTKNPAINVITLFNQSSVQGPFQYQLMNNSGQLLLKGTINLPARGTGVIDLPVQISSGVYYLEVFNTQLRFSNNIFVSH